MWIEWRLQALMTADELSPVGLWELMKDRAGVEMPFKRISALVNERQPRVGLDELQWLCEIFDCQVGDLLTLRDGEYPWGPPSPLYAVPDEE